MSAFSAQERDALSWAEGERRAFACLNVSNDQELSTSVSRGLLGAWRGMVVGNSVQVAFFDALVKSRPMAFFEDVNKSSYLKIAL
ncbi:MAG: hypothetical protein ACYC5X_09540, partial [Syntrophales bacterium]